VSELFAFDASSAMILLFVPDAPKSSKMQLKTNFDDVVLSLPAMYCGFGDAFLLTLLIFFSPKPTTMNFVLVLCFAFLKCVLLSTDHNGAPFGALALEWEHKTHIDRDIVAGITQTEIPTRLRHKHNLNGSQNRAISTSK